MIEEFDGKRPRVHPTAFIAKTAEIVGDVEIGENSSVWNGAVLRGDLHYIRVGKNTSVQDNCVLHGTLDKYPTIVGDNVSIGHNAIVHGCMVGDNCLIGMGSIVLENVEIGEWCIIGAGAVVPEGARIPSNSIVMGVPAKVVKRVTEEHKKRMSDNWKIYVKLKDKYMSAMNGRKR